MSHRDGPCSRSAVVACCVAIGMLQRHVGVGSDRSPAALPLPLRLSVGGARRESHSDTLPISRACEWSHSQAAMCRNECERDGKRHDWQNKKTETRVPAFKGYTSSTQHKQSQRRAFYLFDNFLSHTNPSRMIISQGQQLACTNREMLVFIERHLSCFCFCFVWSQIYRAASAG